MVRVEGLIDQGEIVTAVFPLQFQHVAKHPRFVLRKSIDESKILYKKITNDDDAITFPIA